MAPWVLPFAYCGWHNPVGNDLPPLPCQASRTDDISVLESCPHVGPRFMDLPPDLFAPGTGTHNVEIHFMGVLITHHMAEYITPHLKFYPLLQQFLCSVVQGLTLWSLRCFVSFHVPLNNCEFGALACASSHSLVAHSCSPSVVRLMAAAVMTNPVNLAFQRVLGELEIWTGHMH